MATLLLTKQPSHARLINLLSRAFGIFDNGFRHLGRGSHDLLVKLLSTALHGLLGNTSRPRRKLIEALIDAVGLGAPTARLRERRIKATLERTCKMIERMAKVKRRDDAGDSDQR